MSFNTREKVMIRMAINDREYRLRELIEQLNKHEASECSNLIIIYEKELKEIVELQEKI